MSTTTVPSPDEPDQPRPAWGHSPRPPSLHFVAGLPRSGATLLMSLLHQNPRIHAAPTSGLGLVFHEFRERWTRNPYHAETPRDDARDRCLRALLASYHETDRALVLDKQRMWIAAIPDLERLLGRPVRLLVPVRAVVDVVASFEVLRGRQGAFLPNVDRALGPSSTATQRARYYLAPDGAIGAPLAQLQTAVASGFADRMLFIDYD
jgi:sulfotransferase